MQANEIKINSTHIADIPDSYIEAPDYVYVKLDSEDRILYGVTYCGDFFFGAGCPLQVKDYVEKRILSSEYLNIVTFLSDYLDNDTTLKSIIDGINEVIPELIENPEWIEVKVDENDKVLSGIKKDGTIYNNSLSSPTIDVIEEKLKDFDKNEITSLKNDVKYLKTYTRFLNGYASVASETEIFTIDDYPEGMQFYVEFTLTGIYGAIGLFREPVWDEEQQKYVEQRISWYGCGEITEPGYTYKGSIKIPSGFKYAKIIWGSVIDLILYEIDFNSILSINDAVESLSLNESPIKSYFEEPMRRTIDTIDKLTAKPSVVIPILTDSHMGTSGRGLILPYETIANIRHLCKHCYCDGVTHLGDILMVNWMTYRNNENARALGYSSFDDVTDPAIKQKITDLSDMDNYTAMQDYLLRLSDTNNHCFAVNGNHDGKSANVFFSDRWYGMIGRKQLEDVLTNGYENQAYFYVNYEKCKLRCIFLSQPDSYKNAGPTFGWTIEQLNWLATIALDVTDGWNVVMFSHIPPFQASYIGGGVLPNRAVFYGICNAFNNHTSYSSSGISCNFENKQNSRILLEMCGHVHGDWVYASGERFLGDATHIDGTSSVVEWLYVNEMPCPVVLITNTYVGSSGDGVTRSGDCGVYHVSRADLSKTQDAWDIMVYSEKDKNEITLVRFGSGRNRIIKTVANEVSVGNTYQLQSSLTGNITWSSANTDYATVNSSGLVNCLSRGSAEPRENVGVSIIAKDENDNMEIFSIKIN